MRLSRTAHLVRTTSCTAVAGLAAGLVLAGPPAQAALAPGDDALAASQWLVDQLDEDHLLRSEHSWGTATHYGPTLDGVLALRAARTKPVVRARMLDSVAAHRLDYVSGGDPTETYVGALAKLATTGLIEGRDMRTFAGGGLLARLRDRVVTADTRQKGRVRDQSRFGDYSSTYSQAWSVRALSRGKVLHRRDATAFLLKQQCTAGFFRESLKSSDFTCNTGRKEGTSAPDVDATALAVLALRDARAAGITGLGDDIRDALDWLVRVQQDNGSYVGTGVPNANSTGLTAWVLRLSGRTTPARRATAWLARRQVEAAQVVGTALEGESGAVAYNHAAYLEARENGITQGSVRDQWLVSATQAVPGLIPPQ